MGAKVESAGEWTKICHSDKMGDDWGKNNVFLKTVNLTAKNISSAAINSVLHFDETYQG